MHWRAGLLSTYRARSARTERVNQLAEDIRQLKDYNSSNRGILISRFIGLNKA